MLRLHSLTAGTYNGFVAEAVGSDDESGRVKVRLSSGKVISVREANTRALDGMNRRSWRYRRAVLSIFRRSLTASCGSFFGSLTGGWETASSRVLRRRASWTWRSVKGMLA
jgi:hypothetical protein